MNENWETLQDQALRGTGKNTDFGELNPSKMTNEEQYYHRKPLFHVSLTPTRGSPDSDGIPEEHYKYQVIYSELFDWLLSCEDSLRRQSPAFVNADIIKSRLASLQVRVELFTNLLIIICY